MTPVDVAIIGGGVGGLSTAAALRTGGFSGTVTIIDSAEVPYDRPPLSKDYLAGTSSLDAIALHGPEWYEAHEVNLCSRSRAVRVNSDEGTVELDDGRRIRANKVVLATGGAAARPPLPGVDLAAVHTLRDVEDADKLREVLLPGARILVVGAGLIGAEVASVGTQLGCHVTLIDPLHSPLAGTLGIEAASWLHDMHASHGIDTWTASVQGFEQNGDAVRVAIQDEHFDFDAVVLGVGMRPNTELAEMSGLLVDRGILVDVGQMTSNSHILAVGDATRRSIHGAPVHGAEHWDAAQQDGARAAATMLGEPLPPESSPWFWTDRHGVHVEVVGSMSTAATTVLRGTFGVPPFSIFGVRAGRLVAAVAVDDSRAVRAARRMIDRRAAVSTEQLADPGADLRRLVRG